MNDSSRTRADQSGAQADGDIVGRDKYVKQMHFAERRRQIDAWLDKLAEELERDAHVRNFVDSLQYYLRPFEYDGVKGLSDKLKHAGRERQITKALRKKEAFAKLLEDWRGFPAAQEIIAFFLSQIESCFETRIEPLLGSESSENVDQAIQDHLVKPVIDAMGDGPFMLNYNTVNGMVYWLAEQCYVRWHQ